MCNCNKKQKFPSITIYDDGHEITHQFSYYDPNFSDWLQAFKGLLVGITFSEKTIDKGIIECTKELIDNEALSNM